MPDVPDFSLEVISAPEGVISLRDDWRHLDEVVSHPTIFLTWEWMEAWLHAVEWKRRMHVVVLRDKSGAVAAIAPFMIGAKGVLDWGRRVLSFIGSDGPSGGTYLDLIARPDWEGHARYIVLRHLVENRDLFTYINLNRVAVDNSGFRHWTTAALDLELHATVDLRRRTVWMPLPPTYSDFIASVSNPRWRQRMRNFPAALLKEFPSARYLDRRDERPLDAVLGDLRRLQSMRFGENSNYFRRIGFASYMKRLCENMQERGRFRAHCLMIDGQAVTQRLGLVHRGTWIDFQVGSSPEYMKSNVAHIMLWHCVEHAIGQGLQCMDSLDEYEYKKRYFTRTRWVADLRFFDERLRTAGRQIWKAGYRAMRRSIRDRVPEPLRAWLRRR